MTFVRRRIDVTIDGSTANPPQPTHRLSGHRVTASIRVSGQPAYGQAEVTIFGLKQSLLNALATYGQPIQPQWPYTLTVEAGDDVNGMSTVFVGQVYQAWADFSSQPDVPFIIVAYPQAVPATMRSQGGQSDYTTYKGAVPAAQVLQRAAFNMGYRFENGGIQDVINNPYVFGSPLRQAELVQEAIDCMMCLENGVLAAWPLSQSRPGGGLVVSKETGMVGAPSFTNTGVIVKAEFTRYANYGTEFTVKSAAIPKADGRWSLIQTDLDLQAETPNGHWFATLYGSKMGANATRPLPNF